MFVCIHTNINNQESIGNMVEIEINLDTTEKKNKLHEYFFLLLSKDYSTHGGDSRLIN